ncbi:flocculation protein FLO11 isoform X2 [Parambassis ranga]|nr:flocculation protein FLO11-like isoform X2 [Parambassis ranga]
MLSSTVVTVLAPHWSGRLRRSKRFDGSGNSEGNSQDVPNTAATCEHSFQETQSGMKSVLTDRPRAQFLGSRRNTVGWSAKSDPSSLDYQSKREITQTVSLDVNTGRMHNRDIDAGALRSPLSTAASSRPPFFHNPNEQRRSPHTDLQRGFSSFSSKQTTSSLLLSLRSFNPSDRNSNSEGNTSSLSADGNEKLFATHLSQAFLNNNEQEKTKPLLSPSYRTSDTGPDLSPSAGAHRDRNTPDSVFFSTSPVNRDAEGLHFQHHHMISRTQSSQGLSERQQNSRTSETPLCSPRRSPFDHSALQKTHSFPRRTTLTSTSWWKQVTQDSSSPHPLNNSTTVRDKTNTPFIPPCGDNGDTTVPSLTDSKRLGSQILSNRDNNKTTESAFKGNVNLQTQGTHNIKQTNAENSPDPRPDRLIKQQCGSYLNNREPQKPHRVPDVLTSSKISRASTQTTLSHHKDPCKNDVSSSSFTPNVTELPPTLLNPNSSNTPTESGSKYKINHCPPKANNAPISPHNTDSRRFTKQSLSLDLSTSLNSRALTSQNASGVPPNTRSLSFHSHPQTSINTGSSSLMPKFTNKTNTTPLGFERSYAPIPKPFQPNPSSHLVATTNSSQNLLSLPAKSFPTSVTVSSLLTPPATPITSPSYSETSSPKGGRTFSNSPETDPKKPEGKKVRRVTWEDSVDVHAQAATVEKPNPSRVQTNPISPPRFPRTTPSIFSFLRSSSPSTSTSLCSPNPKTSSILVGKGGKYRSLSSDSAERDRNKQRPGDGVNFVQGFTTPRQERTLSVESGTVQCHPSAALSLPPDFSSDYNLRYSSPPYSAMKSSRLAQGETKTMTPRVPLFSNSSQSNYTPQSSLHSDLGAVMASSTSRPPLSPIRPLQPLSSSIQKNTPAQEVSKCELSESDHINNNHNKNESQDHLNSQILLVDNRVQVSSKSSQVDKTHHSSSTYVTETLVYSIKSKVETATAAPKNATPKPLQHNANTPVSVETSLSQQSHTVQRKEAGDNPCTHSDRSSSGSSSTEIQSRDDEGCSKISKENVLGKSRFFSVEVNNEQSPKRSRFALKKSISTPSSSLSRSESEKANKSNNRMDQVLNRLRQKFSTRRSEEDLSFPWKWKRASQAPSVSGSSDTSNVSDISGESAKTLEKKERVLSNNKREEEGTSGWTQNRYTIITPAAESTVCSEPVETEQVDQNVCAEHTPENKLHLTVHGPAAHKFDFYKDGPDYKTTNQFLSCRDLSPGRSPNPSATCPSQFRKSTPSPRSPFSPFSSLSPVSPFSSPDVTDDSVFYSPKLQRRRESSSPCELSEGISLGGRRRSRASTGPPSASPGQDKDHLTSSYADLKYGIEPGRSFSVSSVLSSRPSGPGRISTGSRFMSVGDLSQTALSCRGNSRDLDQWCSTSDGTTGFGFQPNDHRMSSFPGDPGKMRSRSLPRSLTRCLTNWSSEVPTSQPVKATASKPAHLWSPNMNMCHFAWDTDGPPTPPPTPPLSPVSRRMSQPPSQSSPTFPSSPGAPQQGDSQSSRGLLPSRGYISSLSTFEESSDSSSDTTTDDEYYLETDDDGEKETEL